MDSIPHSPGEAKWIIFKGNLPQYLQRGRLPRRKAPVELRGNEDEEVVKILNERQEDGVRNFAKAIAENCATYSGFYIQCTCSYGL
jgi:hypothetical protein